MGAQMTEEVDASLARKLGIRPGQRICLLDAPAQAAEVIERAAAGSATITDRLDALPYDSVFWWPAALEGFAEQMATLRCHITPSGSVWVVIPKKAFAARRGVTFTWEQMQAAALTTDLVDNKIAALTAEEYATRFVIRKDRRGG